MVRLRKGLRANYNNQLLHRSMLQLGQRTLADRVLITVEVEEVVTVVSIPMLVGKELRV